MSRTAVVPKCPDINSNTYIRNVWYNSLASTIAQLFLPMNGVGVIMTMSILPLFPFFKYTHYFNNFGDINGLTFPQSLDRTSKETNAGGVSFFFLILISNVLVKITSH